MTTYEALLEGYDDYCNKNDCETCALKGYISCQLAYASAILNRVCEQYEEEDNIC